jgi:predicted dithiol-disulfide oxidoreductase (DUF899 family)
MASIEQTAPPPAARREQALAAQRRLGWGARWISSFRGEMSADGHSSLKPEDVARGQVFYNSTGCWV